MTIDHSIRLSNKLLKFFVIEHMYEMWFKRFSDIWLSVAAIILLIPVWVPVCMVLLLTGEHRVFYIQERIGYRNQSFRIWKFITMRAGSEHLENGHYTLRNDPRILPMGRFLHQIKLNEIPQFINVLRGEMSLVGPRPLLHQTFLPYPRHVQENIYAIKPGLTGIGSIIFRDEERLLSETTLPVAEFYATHISPYKGELELWYQKNLSLTTDLMLIFLTAWVILFPQSNLPYQIFKDLPPRPPALR